MRTRKGYLVWFVLLSVLFLGLSGFEACDNGDDEDLGKPGKPKAHDPEDVASVGTGVCTWCHTRNVDQWLAGQHGNLESHDAATWTLDSSGFPDYGYFSDPSCATCHDPAGEGYELIADLTGNVPRPVVGCESCHGGGAEHYGAGEMPFPKPGADRCAQCHSEAFPASHQTYHPNGDNIAEYFEESPHLHGEAFHHVAEEGSASARCARCHTDEGFDRYVGIVPGTMNRAEIRAVLHSGVPRIQDPHPVSCYTCHDAHTVTGDQLAILGDSTLGGGYQSSQFNTCTACHQLIKDDATPQIALDGATVTYDGYHDVVISPGGSVDGDLEQTILDTHAANPGDGRGNVVMDGATFTGYPDEHLWFVKSGDEHACAACHNPHGGNEINEEYAESGHGERGGEAWIHYNWKLASRSSCQRCHTTTGFVNWANAAITGTAYVAANNDFSHLKVNQNETIYCYGCHASVQDQNHSGTIELGEIGHSHVGGLRNPGAVTAEYRAMEDGATVVFPDAKGSNVCIGCHAGRSSGYNVTTVANFTDAGFVNSHYLTAGGNVYRQIGFEYAGENYLTDDSHTLIGSTAYSPDAGEVTGLNGPCAGCHMHAREESHLFRPTENELSEAGGNAILTRACSACHLGEPGGPPEMTIEFLLEQFANYQAAMRAFALVMNEHGYYFQARNPYIFNAASGGSAIRNWTEGTGDATIGKNNMGACFNYNMLLHDPASYIHNKKYTRRLIYDAIDWFDDGHSGGVLGAGTSNDSVAAKLDALLAGGALTADEHARARAFLLTATNGRP